MSRSRWAIAAILIAGWCATQALAWPGQLSYDSIIQLHDGRVGFYHTWHPPIMAWLLGLGDAVMPGAGLFVAFDTTIFFAALLSLVWLRSRPSWVAALVAAGAILLPQCVLYQGIVWKDVLFANAAVAGFVCLAQAEARWGRPRTRLALIAAAFVFFVLATLTRQNGVVVLAVGAAALGAIAAYRTGRIRAILYCAGALIAAAALAAIIAFGLATRSDGVEGPTAQLKLLRLYDLIGAVAHEPSLPLDRLKTGRPELERLIRTDGVRLYSPQRNDTLVGSPALQSALADAEPQLLAAQWRDLILGHPWLYLKVRAEVFRWVFLTPDIAACRPIYVGVDGPADLLRELGLVPGKRPKDLALAAYATRFMGTPAFSHAAFALAAFFALIVLLWRRAPGDIAMAAMLVASFVFTASFFVVSIACDYRYLYFLDLASLSALFYLALGPLYLFQVVATISGSSWLRRSEDRKS